MDIWHESLYNMGYNPIFEAVTEPLRADSIWVLASDGANKSWIQASAYLCAGGNDGGIYYKGEPATIEHDLIGNARLIRKNG